MRGHILCKRNEYIHGGSKVVSRYDVKLQVGGTTIGAVGRTGDDAFTTRKHWAVGSEHNKIKTNMN